MVHGIKFSPEAIASAVLNIYKGKINVDKELEPALFAETVSIFNRALSTGFADALQNGAPLPPDSFTELVKSNIEVFSAFRVHRMQKDIAALLVGDDGKLKSFSQFAKDVKPYVSHQNRIWLETEYNTAVHRAQLASEWQQFLRDADVLPNLRWVPTTSPNVGEDHRLFWNVIRPVGDSFWSVHRPGDRWNCKCSLEQTDKDVTPVPHGSIEKGSTPSRGLDNNPGKDAKLFNEKHPYFPRNCSSCPFKTARLRALFHSLADKKDCYNCPLIQNAFCEDYKRQKYNNKYYNDFVNGFKSYKYGNDTIREKVFKSKSGDKIVVRKKFFTETHAKSCHSKDFIETMDIALQFDKWVSKLKYIKTEQGKHHNYDFRVYQCEYQYKSGKYTITAKVKEKEPLQLYCIRIHKKKD